MARVLPYERVVDAVLTQVGPAHDTEIQNEVKIKEEPDDTTLNTDATGDYMLVKNCSNVINHKSLLSENDVPRENVNNMENKHVSNGHSACSNDVDKTINLKRKNSGTEKEQVRNTLSPPKKKRKCFNEISKNKYTNTLDTTTGDFRRKRKSRSAALDSERKIQRKSRSAKKRSFAECDVCFREFSTLRNCEAHKQYYNAVGNYKCRVCQKRFKIREKLHSHIITCHHIYTAYKIKLYCNFCDRTFKSKEFLQSHLFHAHSKFIFSGNITKYENSRSKNRNTSREDDISKTDKESIHEEYEEPSNPIKSEELNTTLTNNGITSPTKKLRQPTLTEYLELRKKRHDIKPSPSKLNIMKDDFPTFALDHNGGIKENLKRKLLEDDNGHIDSLPSTSSNLPAQMTHSTLEQSQKHDVSLSKKPFVKVHADVEMMKSFLEKLSDTVIKDNMIEDQTNDIFPYDREIPYSLRSLRVTSSAEASINLRKRKGKNMSTTSLFKAGCSTTGTKQNMPESEKVDPNFWRAVMIRFKCKDCTIPLIRCDEESRNFCQISTTMLKNPLTPQCNSMLFQESDIKNNLRFKELEVSLERLTATLPAEETNEETILDIKQQSDDCFLCKVCKKSFSSKSAKRIHIKTSHIAYMSSVCDARYTLKHKLLQHYLQEHLFKSNQCGICYTLLPDYVTLKRHLNVHCLKYLQRRDDQYPVDIEIKCNSAKRTYKCLQCRKTFSSQSTLMVHQNCYTVQKGTEEDHIDSTKETNFSESVSETHCNKNTDEITVTHTEDIQSVDLCVSSSNDSAEKLDARRISLVAEEESQVNEDNQNLTINNNVLVPEEIKTVDKPQDSEKLSENDNSAKSKQDIALTQLDDAKSQVEIHPCDICGKQFHKRKNLEQHIRTFSYSTDKCPMCGTGFSSKRLLRTHITAAHVPQISTTYSYHCMFCNQGFIKKYELRSHVLHLHKQQMLDTFTHDSRADREKSDKSAATCVICNVCNLVFETHNRYVEHRMYYYKNHSFTCSLCSQTFQGMYMFHHHNKLIHYSEDQRKSYSYTCDICKEGFNHETHFHSHNMHVHSNEEVLTEEEDLFDQASKVQEIRNFFIKQQKEIAQFSSEYPCQICRLKCTDIEDLIKHTIFYSNDGDFKCDRCNRRCKTRNILEQHKKLTHICRDVYNGHVCNICSEVLETVTSLVCHKKHFHPDNIYKKADKCKDCGQRLSSNITGKAIEHRCEFNGSNKYRYDCLFCDMKFSNLNTIQTHIAQAHIDDLLAKQAVLKPALPTINSDNIQKQFVQQLPETDQVSSSSTSSSEDNPTQQSDNILKSTLSKNEVKDRTAIKSSDRSENGKITENVLTPAAPLINRSEVNTPTSINVTPSNESKSSTSVPLSSGSTDDSRSNCGIPSTSKSTATLEANLVSSSKRSTDQSEMLNPSSSGFKSVAPQSEKDNRNQNPESVNNVYSNGYTCPLCPIAYPSLLFFHAHLIYAHKPSIRADVGLQLTYNQETQKVSKIECLLCPCVFSDEIKYKKHLRNCHTRYVYIMNSETKTNNASNPPIAQTNDNEGSATPEIITVDDDNAKNTSDQHTIEVATTSDDDNTKNTSDQHTTEVATTSDDDNAKNTSDQHKTEVATTSDDNAKNTSDQHTTEVATTSDDSERNDKIGKLRVKSFAKIIENLSTDHALKLLQSKQVVFHENPETTKSNTDNAPNKV